MYHCSTASQLVLSSFHCFAVRVLSSYCFAVYLYRPHLLGKFCRRQIFSYLFLRTLAFHATRRPMRQFAWNVKAYFLRKISKKIDLIDVYWNLCTQPIKRQILFFFFSVFFFFFFFFFFLFFFFLFCRMLLQASYTLTASNNMQLDCDVSTAFVT